ncbi:uncharacterized protein SAPINGB_P005312 [Magnusiomyces paraingens]|uniref:TAP42-like protein n=1 Tax=Magnusiomyces paraingens TaxID=2606893 RepID=A0A5E8C1R4_9ASCO|nr:uncharacterized protein SAPINGB_P005312 [Saprochaete ingens]VVT56825.1 unnamed protein product [Saprochaete ingens]
MATEDIQPTSLKQAFQNARAATTALLSPPPGSPPRRPDSPSYQADVTQALNLWSRVQSQIHTLALFSPNESLDDLATSEIKYLATEYHLAQTWERKLQLNGKQRAIVVQTAIETYLAFLATIAGYGLLDKDAATAAGAGITSDGPILSPHLVTVLSNPHAGKLDLQEVLRASRSAAGPTSSAESTRAEKIARFKRERALETAAAAAERSTDLHDEDAVRATSILGLQLLALRAVGALDGLAMEQDLLRRFPEPPPTNTASSSSSSSSNTLSGPRERVDILTASRAPQAPLLNPAGKVLRPFTILPSSSGATSGTSSSRQAVLQRVQGTGQYLPTMTVEEYLDEEMKRGGIISGGGEASRKKEDDGKSDEEDTNRAMEAADLKTIKAREWDEFVEANPKGSGNTMNRG